MIINETKHIKFGENMKRDIAYVNLIVNFYAGTSFGLSLYHKVNPTVHLDKDCSF